MLNKEQKRLAVTACPKRKGDSRWTVKSVLNNGGSRINDNGATQSARVLLERLFVQTQKLEELMSRDPLNIPSGLNLETFESDLLAALAALKEKEEDLHDAEGMVLREHTELNRAKEELKQRAEEIAVASSKHEKLEEELKEANLNLASRARVIEYLKLQLENRDQEILVAQSALSLKKDEMDKMRDELMKKTEEVATKDSELQSLAKLLDEANEVVKKQEVELQELQKSIQEKEEELEESIKIRELEGEKLKVAEANLEKRTIDWLLTQESMKKLAEDAAKHMGERNKAMEEFQRVKKLLHDVRSELVYSQKSLASSRQKMEEQEKMVEKQLAELDEQRTSINHYLTSLKDAQIEVESERVKLRVAECQNKELEQDLSAEKELMEEIQEELRKERSSVQQVIQEKSFLQKELDQKTAEFGELQNLLQIKESELVEAKLEIQHLKSEQASLQLILKEKDLELFNAQKRLLKVNQEVAELKMLMNSKEDQLMQATTLLKEKEDYVQIMQHELNDTKLKFSEAESVVERIADLTNKLVICAKDEECTAVSPFDDVGQNSLNLLLEKPANDFERQEKRLETELELTRESLRMKEMEVVAAQRALAIKGEELKTALDILDAREKELQRIKEGRMEDAEDLKNLYALALERIGDKTVGDLAIEKLQLEAAQLEVEAATSALQKLAELSHELLDEINLSISSETDAAVVMPKSWDTWLSALRNNENLHEVKTEVARLLAITDQLVQEAGVVGAAN